MKTPQNCLPWQQALTDCITSPKELFQELSLPHVQVKGEILSQFSLRVPRGFVARMKKGDIHDPLLRQVLPVSKELDTLKGFSFDPLNEKGVSPTPGILHKYPGRVLLVLTGACAIHCRYCFRRHFPYSKHVANHKKWDKFLSYIQGDTGIEEVILSGGDPLVLPDAKLKHLVLKIADIPHVRRLRVHSRLLVTIPERITPSLIDWLCRTRLMPILVVHINHPNEIDEPLKMGLLALKKAGVTVLNQAVLLRGVNDTASSLVALSQKLFDCQILPYYLHLLDRVSGVAHFEVDETKAKRLLTRVAEQLPGYLVPKLVREKAGAKSKIILFPT